MCVCVCVCETLTCFSPFLAPQEEKVEEEVNRVLGESLQELASDMVLRWSEDEEEEEEGDLAKVRWPLSLEGVFPDTSVDGYFSYLH